ncbi:MAG: gliding motility-associated C-terminal domain-containing protein [Chitinophagaceae bacterium]|nr:gliding motility-associated C-terminal domain-containing protein [Chitinophagaceae bacterium]
MHKHLVLCCLLIPLVLICFALTVRAQTCSITEFAKQYSGSENQTIIKNLLIPSKTILNIGNINYLESGIVHNDGWISMYTAGGSVIWSKRLAIPNFDLLQFNDIVAVTDSLYFITATIQTYWGVRDPAPPNPNWGILICIDGYGNVIWIKKMDQGFDAISETTFLQNIIKTNDGDFILNAVVWKRPPFTSKALIIRMDAKANIKWLTTYNSAVFEFRFNFLNQILQTSNGSQIITAGLIDERFKNKDSIVRVNHYVTGLDYATGQKIWDQSLNIRRQFSNVFTNYLTIKHINELPNGDLSFLGFGDTSFLSVPPYSTRAINIITGSGGNIKKMIGYSTSQHGSYFIDGKKNGNGGNQQFLLNDNNKTVLAEIDASGKLLWQKAYQASQQANSFEYTGSGYYITMNSSASPINNMFLKTDSIGGLACMATTTNVQSSDASTYLSQDDALMEVNNQINPGNLFSTSAYTIKDYPITTTTICTNSCCKDFLDSTNSLTKTVCENDGYRLPNGVPITFSGTYYVTYKTTLGCDSILYYKITILKNPSALALGADTCMEGRDSIIVSATPGYDQYKWNSGFSTSNNFTVKQPGNYTVSITNQCGSKSASINVSSICDAEIFIPTAFTPNGDGLNEKFKILTQPDYQLNSFDIYNRWGEIVFRTTDLNKGWDGNFKGQLQPSGIYTYSISLTSLKTGKQFFKKGAVQLIR